MQNAGEDAAQPLRDGLHGQRRAHAPLAAHADAVKCPEGQECSVVGREAAGEFDHGIEEDVGHERHAAAVAVGEQTEEQRAHRAHGKRGGERPDDVGLTHPEMGGERIDQKHDDEEIKGVERPAEEAGEYGVALLAAEAGLGAERGLGLRRTVAHG